MIPDVQCAGAPDAGPAGSFRHLTSEVTAAIGTPRHRGIDLVASASSDPQVLAGDISYGSLDKALEDEDVDLFACRDNAWVYVGSTTTDGEGHFAYSLGGDDRLPIAMRDLYVSVVGDRSGVGFLGYVAPDGAPLAVSDVDGTLTSSENVFAETIVLGTDVDIQPGAPAAYVVMAAKGYQPVYLGLARGRAYTEVTRSWLAEKGMPRGPLRLAPDLFTLPGQESIDFKTGAMTDLENSGLDIVIGIGNRASDVTAYAQEGVAADMTWMKLPEYQGELQPDLDASLAIGFDAYVDLQNGLIAALAPQ